MGWDETDREISTCRYGARYPYPAFSRAAIAAAVAAAAAAVAGAAAVAQGHAP